MPGDTVSSESCLFYSIVLHVSMLLRTQAVEVLVAVGGQSSVAGRSNQFYPSASGCSVRAFGCCGFSGEHNRGCRGQAGTSRRNPLLPPSLSVLFRLVTRATWNTANRIIYLGTTARASICVEILVWKLMHLWNLLRAGYVQHRGWRRQNCRAGSGAQAGLPSSYSGYPG